MMARQLLFQSGEEERDVEDDGEVEEVEEVEEEEGWVYVGFWMGNNHTMAKLGCK